MKNKNKPKTINQCFTFLTRLQLVPEPAVAPGLEHARDDIDMGDADVLLIAWRSTYLSLQQCNKASGFRSVSELLAVKLQSISFLIWLICGIHLHETHTIIVALSIRLSNDYMF